MVYVLLCELLLHVDHVDHEPAQFTGLPVQLCDSGDDGHAVPSLLGCVVTVYVLLCVLPLQVDQEDHEPAQFTAGGGAGAGAGAGLGDGDGLPLLPGNFLAFALKFNNVLSY